MTKNRSKKKPIAKPNLNSELEKEKKLNPENSIREFPEFTTLQESFIIHYRNGMNIESILKKLKVSRTTLYQWKTNVPGFSECMEDAIDEYMGSLYNRSAPMVLSCFRLLENVFTGNFPPDQRQAVLKLALRFLKSLDCTTKSKDNDDMLIESFAHDLWYNKILPFRKEKQSSELSDSELEPET